MGKRVVPVMLLAACALWACGKPCNRVEYETADIPKRVAAALDYERDVPQGMRSVVSKTDYEDAATAMGVVIAGQTAQPPLPVRAILAASASPCHGSLTYLVEQYYTNPDAAPAMDEMAAGMQPLPPGYDSRHPTKPSANPWQSGSGFALLEKILTVFVDWCVFLPEIEGDQDNGLAYIQNFAWAFYRNQAGQDFVQGRNPREPAAPLATGLEFTHRFSNERGAFMDSPASRTYIQQWIDDPRIEIADYKYRQASDYKSWNEFFAREIIMDEATQTIPSRPVTMPDRDYVVSAPTDCIVNPLVQVLAKDKTVERRFVDNPLQFDMVLDVKGIPIGLARLLKDVPWDLARHFEGGTGISCVLMPNTYHRFHAPVSGTIRYAAIVEDGTYGYIDWPNWVPLSGNVGRPGTDFGQFEVFERAVVIIEVTYSGSTKGDTRTGYVASIPVGLDTIGSVYLGDKVSAGQVVKRGYTELGGFFYGGSLNILLFSKGLASAAVQSRLGNQIAILNAGKAPKVDIPGK